MADQLLAAQVAIEKKDQMLLACSESAKLISRIDKSGGWQKAEKALLETLYLKPDPSLLRAHDAEVRKPLVEALQELFAMIEEGLLVRDISKDHEADYFTKALKFTQRLSKARTPLAQVEEEK